LTFIELSPYGLGGPVTSPARTLVLTFMGYPLSTVSAGLAGRPRAL
jgi:hypothetical protein